MAPLDFMTVSLLFTLFCYALTSLYVIGVLIRPALTSAINGLINLARLAIERNADRN